MIETGMICPGLAWTSLYEPCQGVRPYPLIEAPKCNRYTIIISNYIDMLYDMLWFEIAIKSIIVDMFVVLPGYRVFCPSLTGCSEGRVDTQRSVQKIWPWLNPPPDESLTIVFSCQAPPVFVLNVGLQMLLACFGMFAELLSLFANSGHCGVMNVLARLKNSSR